jgi:hypothetical protein
MVTCSWRYELPQIGLRLTNSIEYNEMPMFRELAVWLQQLGKVIAPLWRDPYRITLLIQGRLSYYYIIC